MLHTTLNREQKKGHIVVSDSILVLIFDYEQQKLSTFQTWSDVISEAVNANVRQLLLYNLGFEVQHVLGNIFDFRTQHLVCSNSQSCQCTASGLQPGERIEPDIKVHNGSLQTPSGEREATFVPLLEVTIGQTLPYSVLPNTKTSIFFHLLVSQP